MAEQARWRMHATLPFRLGARCNHVDEGAQLRLALRPCGKVKKQAGGRRNERLQHPLQAPAVQHRDLFQPSQWLPTT